MAETAGNYARIQASINRKQTMQLSHTNHSGLTLKFFDAYNVTEHKNMKFWQHIDADGRQVGPHYPTKAEALADSFNYACRAGWLQQFGH